MVQVRGIGFIGTHTPERAAMSAFARDVLGLTPVAVDGSTADMFALPNGDVFAVATLHEEGGPAERTVGFLVDDLDTATSELHAAGIETDGIMENDRYRYTHFRAPDGRLYELVEEKPS
jgi:catechol 2,3-dioxygenase-like lactoylglutathione lyase family enzyme